MRRAVLAARSLSYSTGPSGVAPRLFERWGIAQRNCARIVQAPPGVPVGTLVARGEVELGFQQLSELLHVPGITLAGPLPEPSDHHHFLGRGGHSRRPACGRRRCWRSWRPRRRHQPNAARAWSPPSLRRPDTPAPSIQGALGASSSTATATLHHGPQGAGELANAQIAGIQDPAAMPKVADLKISDDELRESIETNQLKLMKSAAATSRCSARAPASWPTTLATSTCPAPGGHLQRLCYRVSTLFPDHFVPVAMLPQSPGVDPPPAFPSWKSA